MAFEKIEYDYGDTLGHEQVNIIQDEILSNVEKINEINSIFTNGVPINKGGTGAIDTNSAFTNLVAPGGTMTGNLTFQNNKFIYGEDTSGNSVRMMNIATNNNFILGSYSLEGNVLLCTHPEKGLYHYILDGTEKGYKILDAGNYGDYVVKKSGGTFTGSVSFNELANMFYDSDGVNASFIPGTTGTGYIGISDKKWGLGYINNLHADTVVQSSDERLKTDMEEIDGEEAAKFIKDLRPIRYRWKEDDGKVHVGFSAQQVEKVTEEYEKTMFGGVERDVSGDEAGRYYLGYAEFHAAEVAAIQYLLKKIDTLESRISEMENTITEMRNAN